MYGLPLRDGSNSGEVAVVESLWWQLLNHCLTLYCNMSPLILLRTVVPPCTCWQASLHPGQPCFITSPCDKLKVLIVPLIEFVILGMALQDIWHLLIIFWITSRLDPTRGPHSKGFKKAIKKEIHQLSEKSTWQGVL